MELNISKDWIRAKAEEETGHDIGAGVQALEGRFLKAFTDNDVLPHPDDPQGLKTFLEQAADDLDCGHDCEHLLRDYEVNHFECTRIDRDGEYCRSDMANALRAASLVIKPKKTEPTP